MEFELYYRDAAPCVVGVDKSAASDVHDGLHAMGYVSLDRWSDFPPVRVYRCGRAWEGADRRSWSELWPEYPDEPVIYDDDDGDVETDDSDVDDDDNNPHRDDLWEGLGRVLAAAGELATHHGPYYHGSLIAMVGPLLDEARALFEDLTEIR